MFRRTILGLGLAILLAAPAAAQDRSITIASTTSTEQSGLFGHILPIFTRETGIQVRVVALGTGQALDMARRQRSATLRILSSRPAGTGAVPLRNASASASPNSNDEAKRRIARRS